MVRPPTCLRCDAPLSQPLSLERETCHECRLARQVAANAEAAQTQTNEETPKGNPMNTYRISGLNALQINGDDVEVTADGSLWVLVASRPILILARGQWSTVMIGTAAVGQASDQAPAGFA
jgi:hypothetical protein